MKISSLPLVLIALLASACVAQDFVFNEFRFRKQVQRALKSAQEILDTTRHPVLLEDAVDHTYFDKYVMVETMTNTAVAASVAVLERLGINDFSTLLDWVHNQKHSVSLQFHLEQQCIFDKKTERKIVTAEQEIERSQGSSGYLGRDTVQTETVKMKQTLHEYHWTVKAPYSLSLVSGTDSIDVYRRGGDNLDTITVSGGATEKPRPPFKNSTTTHSLNLTWLLQTILPEVGGHNIKDVPLSTQFQIQREAESCRTPSRNDEIDRARDFRNELGVWVHDVSSSIRILTQAINQNPGHQPTQPFNPLLPLYENSTVLSETDFDTFLQRHKRDLDSSITTISGWDTPSKGVISNKEYTLTFLIEHLNDIFIHWGDTVAHVEQMLESQLIQAIGKEIDANDFDEFIAFHAQKFFHQDFAPKPFSYSVRRGDQYPDGVVSVEAERYTSSFKTSPIETMSRHIPGGDESAPSIFIPVNAATSVEIRGDRHLHGWVQYQWDSRSHVHSNHLVARANQFSSFLIILGVMGGADKFLPKDAIIVKNKDSVMIDLLTNVLPSAKEFRDAISSLSDEQKAFAQAFRGMQLESSVFGVCIIQIKPQLERLLNLPDGSLNKEIQLTQNLMSLFVDYQIPSDLLSFDGSEDAPIAEKVQAVQAYVKAVLDVIAAEKQKQLEQEKQKREMREQMYAPVSGPSASPSSSPTASPTGGPGSRNQRKLRSADMTFQAMAASVETFEESPPPSSTSHSSNKDSQQSQGRDKPSETANAGKAFVAEDFTMIPKILDAELEAKDRDGALKSTTIKAGTDWFRSRQENLLVEPKRNRLADSERESEKNQAMDLLTAISRSGSLPIDASELHVVVSLTHCFEHDIMRTVVSDNVNPIEKVEASLLLLGSTIQGRPALDLLAAEKREELEGRV